MLVHAGRREGADADRLDALSAMKKAAHSMRGRGVNGSWVSASQGLTGKRALGVFVLVMGGELPCVWA